LGPEVVGLPVVAEEGELPPPIYDDPQFEQTYPLEPEIVGQPDWCESPYRSGGWRFGVDFIPTISNVSDAAFGDWEDDPSLALRLELAYESPSGFGVRTQIWGFSESDVKTPASAVNLDASTFYFDLYKRFFIEDAELALGGGLAGGHLGYGLPFFDEEADFTGGGVSLFGEGFYPFWRFRTTDIGGIANGRLTLLSGEWEDDGTPFMTDTDHDQTTIMELAWGLELRRRVGRQQDKYWYLRLMHDMQRWESSTLPDAFDPGFDGTSISLGFSW
jgi:hypothetical protein